MTAFLEKHLPGFLDLRRDNYGTASAQFAVFFGTLAMIGVYHQTIFLGLESVVLSGWMLAIAFEEGARIFQLAIVEFWFGSIFLLATPAGMK
jgi:hypothetical protein